MLEEQTYANFHQQQNPPKEANIVLLFDRYQISNVLLKIQQPSK